MSTLSERLAKLEDRVDTLETVSDSGKKVKKVKKDKSGKSGKKDKKDKKNKSKSRKTGVIYFVDATPGRGDNVVHNSAVFRESLQRRLADNYDIDCKLHDARHGNSENDDDEPRGSIIFTGSRPLGPYSRDEALRNLPASAHDLPLILMSSGDRYEGEISGAHVMHIPTAHVHDDTSLDSVVDNAAKVLSKE